MKTLFTFCIILLSAVVSFSADATEQTIFTLPVTNTVKGTDWIVVGTGERGDTNIEHNAQIDTVGAYILRNGFSNVLERYQEYDMRRFGARGTGLAMTNCVMELMSSNLTAVNGTFAAGDVGKIISIYGAGQNSNNLTTTIYSFVNATSVVLATTNFVAVANKTAYYGYDDTPAFNNALEFFRTNTGSMTFFVPDGIYIINGAIYEPTPMDIPCYGNTNRLAAQCGKNAQIYLGDFPARGENVRTVKFRGSTAPGIVYVNIPGSVGNSEGAMLVSTLPDLNGGNVFACENYNSSWKAGADLERFINSVRVEFQNMAFRVAQNPNGNCLDLRGAGSAGADNIKIDSGYKVYCVPEPTHPNSFGILLPPPYTDSEHVFGNILVCGFYNAFGVGELIYAPHARAYSCKVAFNMTNSMGHFNWFPGADIAACQTKVLVGNFQCSLLLSMTSENPFCTNATGLAGGPYPAWDYPDTNTPPILISQPNTSLGGEITYRHSDANFENNPRADAPLKIVGPVPRMNIMHIKNIGSWPGYETPLYATNFIGSCHIATNDFYGFRIYQYNDANAAKILFTTKAEDIATTAPYFTMGKVNDANANTTFTISSTTNASAQAPVARLTIRAIDGSVLISGLAGFGGPVVTNNGVCWYSTNDTPAMVLPNGSLATISDGRFYIRTNDTWVLK